MTDIQAVLFGGLGAAISWGFGDYLGAHASKKTGPILAAAVVDVLGAVMFVAIYFLFFFADHHGPLQGSGLAYSLGSGVFLALAAAFFYKGLEKGPVSIVSPIGSLYPMVTAVLAVVVFGASLSAQQVAGIVLILLGVVVAAGLLGAKKRERKIAHGPRFALLAALCWGFSFALLSQGVARLDWQLAAVISYAAIAVTFVIVTPFIKGEEEVSVRSIREALRSKYVLGVTAIGMSGFLVVNFGIAHDTSSGAIVAALSAMYPVITVFLALHHLKELVQPVPLTGALVGIIGVVILSLG